jgi:hypothetical protein
LGALHLATAHRLHTIQFNVSIKVYKFASNTLIKQTVFKSTVSSYGTDTGIRGITIPSELREKGEELYGKEVIVIVILPDDE